ncbi:MAG: sulfurtransferase TusA family protein [SAR324 cluster bacterium]|nr:sulfurtransferase TusA family protein [SAR324 cluster bacterium]MBL7035610.1 sulfurtransferase TusA family protein [SAR324 cluster bacterium]
MGLFSRKTKTEDLQPLDLPEVTLSDGTAYQIAQQIDCIGDSCPRPQMMTKKAINSAATNDVVEIIIDNPSSMEAVPPMAPQIGATHLETVTDDNCWKIYLRKD